MFRKSKSWPKSMTRGQDSGLKLSSCSFLAFGMGTGYPLAPGSSLKPEPVPSPQPQGLLGRHQDQGPGHIPPGQSVVSKCRVFSVPMPS